ncbi:MAG: hypothetical protein JXR37_21345 [Kiritimatiellae bacterium]|nr:hypothetical protein [Kiritimatiellia bacterium]
MKKTWHLRQLRWWLFAVALIQAGLLLTVTFDHGVTHSMNVAAIAGHWVTFFLIGVRRRHGLTTTDAAFVVGSFFVYRASMELAVAILRQLCEQDLRHVRSKAADGHPARIMLMRYERGNDNP